MNVTLFGAGYVGLVTGACLAEVGHTVYCVDTNKEKVNQLNTGISPIFEPGLDDLIIQNMSANRLFFTTDPKTGVEHGDIIFIAVGTPMQEDGSANTQAIFSVAQTIGTYISRPKIIVAKSTAPIGTANAVKAIINNTMAEKNKHHDIDIISNPEFLKQGSAVNDFMKPDRIIIGIDNDQAKNPMRELYQAFNRQKDKIIFTDVRGAELTKYAANAMLATKISFINEIANIADALDIDVELIRQAIGADPRIGYHFIYPGCGYGGSCFPKDTNALIKIAEENQVDTALLKAVEAVNNQQKKSLFNKISRFFNNDLNRKTIAIWGLSFKPNTGDTRESPSIELIRQLLTAGANIKAYDPQAMEAIKTLFPNKAIEFTHSKEEALNNADVLAICTEWKAFWSPDFQAIKDSLRHPAIFDGRNIYNPYQLEEIGIAYFGIGRKNTLAKDHFQKEDYFAPNHLGLVTNTYSQQPLNT